MSLETSVYKKHGDKKKFKPKKKTPPIMARMSLLVMKMYFILSTVTAKTAKTLKIKFRSKKRKKVMLCVSDSRTGIVPSLSFLLIFVNKTQNFVFVFSFCKGTTRSNSHHKNGKIYH